MHRSPRSLRSRFVALLATLSVTAAAAAVAAGGRAQSPANASDSPATVDRLIVLNKAAGTASLFDPAAQKEMAQIEVGAGPHEVAVAPDGHTAVVCNYGDQRPGNSLTILDVPTTKAVATFVLESDEAEGGTTRKRTWLRPHGIRFLADGRHVVVTSEQSRRLLVVDIRERRVVRTLPTPQPQLHMVALANDGAFAFGASLGDGTMSIFDLGVAATTATRTVKTGAGAEGIAVRPGCSEVWVANRAADTLSVVDPVEGKVLAELATSTFPIRVAFTPDGAHALVSCAEAGEVQVFDAKERKLAHTIVLQGDKTELSPLPIGICIAPDGRTAWVACARGEFLAVVDLTTFRLADRVPAGPGPDGMAWARWTVGNGAVDVPSDRDK